MKIMPKTQLKKLVVEKFRALNNVEVEFGDHITVICGKNGTSKSSILGIAAQIFSFEKDYLKGLALSFRQIAGGLFKSQYSEHFRISDEFDQPGSMTVNIELHDGYTDQSATAKLELMKRGKSPRPVVRNNSTVEKGENTSRNFTHPVIFLSLKRLYPIADRDYKVIDFDYLNNHKPQFIGLVNELLNRQSSLATGTEGTISSAVAHGDNYDQESVSAGEDNAGQIILALMSFRKLKEEYADYKGGLLLIDEADAGLFPTAQVNLLKILDRECKDLDLQVVMTSHSPTLIEYAYQQSQQYRRKYKTIYLSNTFGGVQVMQDWSWAQISADINTRTVAAGADEKLPKVNVYFEDKEAADFFAALMNRQSIKKFTNPLPDVTLGCSNYLQLIDKGVPEFSERSIVCLDSDAAQQVRRKNPKTLVLLPGNLPPDQLIFEYLFNLPAEHNFWRNDLGYARPNFTQSAAEVIREFSINGNQVDVKTSLAAYQGGKKPREVFKRFYKDAEFQKLVALASKPYNPWKHWIENNQDACNDFLEKFELALRGVMSGGYAVDANKLATLKVKLKGG
ncbi:AAA family ATPase [Azospira sp. I09]|uniref:AAA family ATPase n=1 Tax=Azospira sp. I09 TaxID=1765049 RepID=UPI001261103D|nr:AAA family ATPase [Azospira sp. I09]